MRIIITLSSICIVLVLSLLFLLPYVAQQYDLPTKTFPVGQDIKVETGSSIQGIARKFEALGIIRSQWYFRYLFKTQFEDMHILAGTYYFEKPYSTTELITILIKGDQQSPDLTSTFPEGFRAQDLYKFLPKSFPHDTTIDLESYEGHLFPDTYNFKSDASTTNVIEILTKNFEIKTQKFKEREQPTNLSFEDVIILASIIEREAKDPDSMKKVSGILQKRLALGMPLQVDATFDYLFNVTSNEVTEAHLDSDSPYNTYVHTGLPPTPIANPGLESIRAVYEPELTDYLYYLTAPDGTFYYAKTFDAHKVNKERYLR